jgi:hypothetical protein
MRTFWAQPLFGHERLGGGDEGDVVMPAGPGTDFEMVQAQSVLELAITVLDAPADRIFARRTSSVIGVSAAGFESTWSVGCAEPSGHSADSHTRRCRAGAMVAGPAPNCQVTIADPDGPSLTQVPLLSARVAISST